MEMNPFIKICGICSKHDLEQISAFQPNALGFIQWKKSARYIAPEQVGEWETPPPILRVGVFVNPTEAELAHAAAQARFDVLQVHRVSNDWKIAREKFQGLELWRAGTPEDFLTTEVNSLFDRVLLDFFDPKTVGGTGKTCDWNRASEVVQASNVPVLLAGGLNAQNVGEALKRVQPWGVDISSGVEKEPGVKDLAKVEAFIAACRIPQK